MTENLSVTVIGCSGTYSSTDSSCSSYLFETATTSVLVDAGPGSSIELQKHIDLADLDAIIVSHEHPDHWTELPSLYHGFRYGIQRLGTPVYGTAGTKTLLDAACPEANATTYDWQTIDADSVLAIGDITFKFSLTDHPVETLAVLAESGDRRIGYSADTGPDWSPESFGEPIDIFIYETTLPDDMEDMEIPHVSGRQAGERATAANIGQLVITHVPPGHDRADRHDAASVTFDGPIAVAIPGLTLTA